MSDQDKPKLADALKGQQPKLADALKDQQPQVDGGDGTSVHPEQSPDQFNAAEARQSNREVNAGIENQDERLVRLGRGQDTKGRGSQKGG